jgi:hypothetical protein
VSFLEDEQLLTSTADVWAATDRTLGLYLLFNGSEANPGTTSRALVYCTAARAWTSWPVDWTGFCREPVNGRIIVGLSNVPRVGTENTGNGDAVGRTTITVVTQPTDTTLTFVDASDMAIGDMLTWTVTHGPSSVTRRAVITDVTGTTVTLNTSHGSVFTPGTSTVRHFSAFPVVIETVPLHGGGNGIDKQARGVTLTLDSEQFESATVDVAGGDVGQAFGRAKTLNRWGWGNRTWGEFRWGDYDGPRPERCAIPAESQRAPFHSVRFTINEAGARWRLLATSIDFEPGTEKGRK